MVAVALSVIGLKLITGVILPIFVGVSLFLVGCKLSIGACFVIAVCASLMLVGRLPSTTSVLWFGLLSVHGATSA